MVFTINGFALNHDKSLQIFLFCVKLQAKKKKKKKKKKKNDFLEDFKSTVLSYFNTIEHYSGLLRRFTKPLMS